MYVCMYVREPVDDCAAHTQRGQASWINPFQLRWFNESELACFVFFCFVFWHADIHLSELFQHQGEDPEVEDDLGRSGSLRRRRAEVEQQHVGEEEEEGEVHDDVAQEHGDGGAPEAAPAAEQEAPPDGGAALNGRASG